MLSDDKKTRLLDWIEDHASVCDFTPVLCDLNGVFRGKRLPMTSARKAAEGELKLPLSTLFVDIWGRDTIGSGKVLETGDRDGVLIPTDRGFLPLDWRARPTALLPVCMHEAGGGAYPADPRNALARIVEDYRARDLTPVCAAELEFYLYEPNGPGEGISPPQLAAKARRLSESGVYSVGGLDHFDQFFDDVYAACDQMGVPAEAAISEGGCGQFEVNLKHRPDPLRVADDAQIFKYIVKGVARAHGLAATFMAKPYGDEPGSGFHTHFSLLDADDGNVFADGSDSGSDALRQAVGGLLELLPESMLALAPHANSYRRLRRRSHAPINRSWGYDNRTAAVRIPSGPDHSRRIEHRVAGADANPYLVLAVILGGALAGLDRKLDPGEPTQENAYASGRAGLPATWLEATELFGASDAMRALFGDHLVDMFLACKRQEQNTFARTVPDEEYDAYLESV